MIRVAVTWKFTISTGSKKPEGAQLLVCSMKGIVDENLSATPRTWVPRGPVNRARPFVWPASSPGVGHSARGVEDVVDNWAQAGPGKGDAHLVADRVELALDDLPGERVE